MNEFIPTLVALTVVFGFILLGLTLRKIRNSHHHNTWIEVDMTEIDILVRELDSKVQKVKFPDNNELIDNGEDNG